MAEVETRALLKDLQNDLDQIKKSGQEYEVLYLLGRMVENVKITQKLVIKNL